MKYNSCDEEVTFLSKKEKIRLILEAVVTFGLLCLLNLSLLVLLNLLILGSSKFVDGILLFNNTLNNWNHLPFFAWQKVIINVIFVLELFVVYLRMMRRYHQFQMYHIIKELHYIADGHFNYRIPFKFKGPLQDVVDSINALVDSTCMAISEEKAVEKSKDELIANLSHDLRTPLTSIIGYMSLLKMHQNSMLPAQRQEYLNIVFDKSLQMKSMTNDLFEYATLNFSHDKKLELEQIKISSLIEQIAAGFALEAEKKQIDIKTSCEPQDLEIAVDVKKIVRMFNNLISNAVKYGVGAKNIYVSVKKISNDMVQIIVSNDGQAIPQDALGKLFDRFYRVEESRSPKTGGSGLGLAITKTIVEMHHGTIFCTSNQKLTSFIIALPINIQKNNLDVL